MDCTYNTNKAKLPFLYVVGCTNKNTTFPVVFGLLGGETSDTYRWALRWINQQLISLGIEGPQVVITDRGLALMNALRDEMPYAQYLLCIWHIKKAVRDWLKRTGLPNGLVTHYINLWNAVMEAETQDTYNKAIAVLRKEAPPKLIAYLEEFWIPHASKFVAFHTNQHFHLGQRTSSRVEGAHAKLKRELQTSRCDVDRLVQICVSIVDSYLQQWRQGSAADEMNPSIRWLEEPFFVEVLRKVSAVAIKEVSANLKRVVLLGLTYF